MENDGRSIHLYYDAEKWGDYVAYGFSAFFVSHIVEPRCSYSETLQMPVALLHRSEVQELRRVSDGPSGDYGDYVRFVMHKEIPLDGYQRWMEREKKRL